MKVLKDINATWVYVGQIPVPSYLAAAKYNMKVFSINNMPVFVWPVSDAGIHGRFVLLHVAPNGQSSLTENFVPMGLNDQTNPDIYIYDNKIITIYSTDVVRSQCAFDPATGLIASIHPAIKQPGFSQWCPPGLNRSIEAFPASLATPLFLYGYASGGGTVTGSGGGFVRTLYPERGDSSSDSWTSNDAGTRPLVNYFGPTNNGYIDGNGFNTVAIPAGEGIIGFLSKPDLNTDPNYYVNVKHVSLKDKWNAGDCTKNKLTFESTDILNLNLYPIYGLRNFGSAPYSFSIPNYYSCAVKVGDNFLVPRNDWVIYIKYQGPVLQRMILPVAGQSGSNPDTWGTYVYEDGTVLKIGCRLSDGNFLWVYKSSVNLDTSPPQFDLPAFPIQPAPIRSSDLRTLYRSK